MFYIDNKMIFFAWNQHIQMISEGSCDTEVMMLKIQLCIRNKWPFKIITIENNYFNL